MKNIGEEVPGTLEGEIMAWWERPATFNEARALWSQYVSLAASGTLSSTAVPSSSLTLEDVLLADAQARSGGAAGSSGGDMDQEALQQVERQLRDLYLSYSAHHGSTTGAAVRPDDSGSTTVALPPSWADVQSHNSSLSLESGEQLAGSFRAATLGDVLRSHWSSVAARFGLLAGEGAEGKPLDAPAVPTWDDMWTLMGRTYEAVQQGARPASAVAGDGTSGARSSSSSSIASSAGAAVASDDASSSSTAEEDWDEYLVASEMRQAETEHAAGAGQPPYPGEGVEVDGLREDGQT